MLVSPAAIKYAHGNMSLAEDIQQEINASMLQGRNFFEAVRDGIDFVRRYTRCATKCGELVSPWPGIDWCVDPNCTTEDMILTDIMVERIFDCWPKESIERKMLVMHFIEGFTYKEIGEQYGMSRWWASMKVCRMLKLIKEKYNDGRNSRPSIQGSVESQDDER